MFTVNGVPSYTVKYKNDVVIDTSALGLEINHQPIANNNCQLIIEGRYKIQENYASLGGHSLSTNNCNDYVLPCVI